MGSFLVAENAAPARSKIKRPIIVLSHGYTGNPHQLSWLIKGLVNQGFIVLDIQHLDLIDDLVMRFIFFNPKIILLLQI